MATFFFEIRGQDALIKLFNDTIVADQKALDYNRAQYDTGITDQISVVEAENTLQNAQASATNLGVARAQFEHAIAVLIGRVASNFSIPVKVLNAAPPPIPIGVPSQLLERRPDVAASERAMASANAQIGIAYAAYFPTLLWVAKTDLRVRNSALYSMPPIIPGQSDLRSLKRFSTRDCAAPRSAKTLRPITRIWRPTGRMC